MNESQVFADALRLATPAERAAYLDAACAGEPGLRAALDALLRAHAAAPDFLEAPLACPAETVGWAPVPGLPTEPGCAGQPGAVLAGRYKLLEPIGAGGMGAVWLAQQTDPVRRLVAVKLIKPGMDSRQVLARFEQEQQALAQMDHPNIARVLDGGATPDGRPFLVLELVKGVPVTRYCDDGRLSPRARLRLFADVCHAVQHAHQKGVIHRDLKPSNVLVAPFDGRPVVKVIDFGVAKAAGQPLTEKTLFTGIGAVVGTPEYMSPEQAELNNRDVDTRSDVYSLGVLLYELLAGTTPLTPRRVRETALLEVLRAIREEEPPRPSVRLSESKAALPAISAVRATDPAKLTRLVRGELDWIVMKAIDKDRDRRYETASALAADVQRYLDDEPVQACPPSVWYRGRKLARRNRRALATAAALAAAALVGVGALAVSTALVWKANEDLKEAVERERREVYFQRITVAHRELSTDNLAAARRALGECPEDLRGWEWYYLMRLCKVEPLVIRDRAEVSGVAFSPDGERLASAGGDGAVRIWDSRSGRVIQEFRAHDKAACSVAYHPGGKHIASAGVDGRVKVWDVTDSATGREVFAGECDALRQFGSASTVAFSPDGRRLAAGSKGVVRVWDWENRQLLHAFPGHVFHSISVAFSPDGRRLATATGREEQRIWDAETGGPPLRAFPAHGHPVGALAFSPDGRRLASASFDWTVKVWDTTTGGVHHTLVHSGNVECVAFSPDGRRIASAGEDKTVRVWDAATGRELLGLRGHAGRCGCVAFSPDPDGRRLASASTDGTIRVWDATPLREGEGQEVLTFTRHRDELRGVAFSPDGGTVASAGRGGVVRVWDAATGDPRFEFTGHTGIVFCLAWQPGGHRIASAGLAGPLQTVKVWDARDGRESFVLPAEQFAVPYTALAFTPPDGRFLVTGNLDGAVQVWDAGTGRAVGTLGTHDREVRGVVISRDGRHLASASADGEVKLWDATRLTEQQDPRLAPIHARVPGPTSNLAFSPDGRRLATGGEENTVKVWDVQTGQELRTLRGHNGEVYAVAFSPDAAGRWIASAGEDSAVRVWDGRTGKVVRTFRGHTGLVSSVAFSPDGRRLVSGSRDRTARVWDVSQLNKTPDR